MNLRLSGFLLLPVLALCGLSQAQELFETTSLLGQKLYALPDQDGAIAKAKRALASDPRNVALVIALSKAQAGKRQYREAIATDSAGLISAPKNAELLIERGHRQLGLRQFKAAMEDLSMAAKVDPTQLDAFYHLGLSYYFQGEFDKAAKAFQSALDLAKSSDSVIDCSNWLYVSRRRAGQTGAAAQVLTRITPDVKNTEPHLYFYLQLLHFYQGKISEAQVLPPKPARPDDTEAELSFNTVTYGVGNWHLYNGDAKAAQPLFKKVVTGAAWNSWGFIGSEVELAHSNK